MRIVFATAEVSPIAKTGGLGDVCGSLPKALRELGHEVVIFMPMYRQAREWFAKNNVEPEPLGERFMLSWADWTTDIRFFRTSLPGTDIPLVLTENQFLFERPHIYSPRPDGSDDYLERYTIFCRAVINACERFQFAPDILHAHDWHTALLPVYLHSGLRGSEVFRNTRSVFTIHNLNYQGVAGSDQLRHLGLHSRYWAPDAIEHFRDVNLMKGGIMMADQVTTVSPNYAHEIRTPEHGAGLDGVLREVWWKVTGILNGIDTEEWNPATDSLLEANFEAGHLHGKAISKRMLAKEAGLEHRPTAPLIGVVSRLVDQKGFQLLIPVMHRLIDAGAQFVVLGSGDPRFEEAFAQIAAQRPDAAKAWLTFDNSLAHRIYAGSDMLLMPSIYEPCGLNQMYALRYGTIPVVRMTGGLADTVTPFDGTNLPQANGFGFFGQSPSELYTATWLSMLNYKDPGLWNTLQFTGMREDFSWHRSAREYEAVYRRALGW
ncbi:MAG: glycogen synthase [Acidobacteria bacterium]|nr:glycogen synthase [Acidobacteriota bacterium]